MVATGDVLARWLDLLRSEPTGPDAARAHHPSGGPVRTFGGQLLAQGLYAAGRDVAGPDLAAPATSRPALRPAAVHAAFLRAGDSTRDLDLHLDERRDGRSSARRSVRIGQDGVTLCRLEVSFTIATPADEHAGSPGPAPPEAPPRASTGAGLPLSLLGLPQPVELVSDRRHSWVRAPRHAPPDPLVQACLLAWASDLTAFDAAGRLPHVARWGAEITRVSLDHHLWFHTTPDLAGWLLLDQSCIPGEAGSTFTRGRYMDAAGRPVASLAQEGVVRRRRRNP